jgi:hypothetical protein
MENGMPYPIKIENEPKFSFPQGMHGAGFDGFGGMFGGGGSGMAGLLFGLLLGNRNGGLFGGNNGGDPMAALALGQLSDIKAAVPLAAAQTEASIARSENALSNQANQNLIATLQAINSVSSKVDAATITQLQTELMESRGFGRARENEVTVSQTVNQAQAQNQMQSQLSGLHGLVGGLVNQVNRANQDIINLGSMTGSGVQTAVGRN